ncbi:hypothetical protein E2C01_008069 [Portunus trituberculatus]|uniref:Uncharacterized protein n=1 Tax=Portunus trituberculatus TaxID=210409 RepID=A0A5B7D546_PORTR|nr:hypothetical protein [Portunus trituberculatus]
MRTLLSQSQAPAVPTLLPTSPWDVPLGWIGNIPRVLAQSQLEPTHLGPGTHVQIPPAWDLWDLARDLPSTCLDLY